jgi:hypothetical protein
MRVGLLAWTSLGVAVAGAAHAQSDPLLVRLNGTRTLTRDVLPALVLENGGLDKAVNELALWSQTSTLLGVGTRTDVSLSGLRLTVPVGADDVTAAFADGTSNRARLRTDYHFDGARLRMTYHVKTVPLNPLVELPDAIAIDQAYAIEVSGIRGELDVLAKPAGGFLEVDKVEKLTIAVDRVRVDDEAALTELANGVLGFGLLFGVAYQGCETVNRCFTWLANRLLDRDLGMRAMLLPHLNASLRAVHALEFLDRQLPFVRGAKLDVNGSLASIGSKVDFATTGWNVSLVGSPGGKVPGLA